MAIDEIYVNLTIGRDFFGGQGHTSPGLLNFETQNPTQICSPINNPRSPWLWLPTMKLQCNISVLYEASEGSRKSHERQNEIRPHLCERGGGIKSLLYIM